MQPAQRMCMLRKRLCLLHAFLWLYTAAGHKAAALAF
jgi:hypothetical protein